MLTLIASKTITKQSKLILPEAVLYSLNAAVPQSPSNPRQSNRTVHYLRLSITGASSKKRAEKLKIRGDQGLLGGGSDERSLG